MSFFFDHFSHYILKNLKYYSFFENDAESYQKDTLYQAFKNQDLRNSFLIFNKLIAEIPFHNKFMRLSLWCFISPFIFISDVEVDLNKLAILINICSY